MARPSNDPVSSRSRRSRSRTLRSVAGPWRTRGSPPTISAARHPVSASNAGLTYSTRGPGTSSWASVSITALREAWTAWARAWVSDSSGAGVEPKSLAAGCWRPSAAARRTRSLPEIIGRSSGRSVAQQHRGDLRHLEGLQDHRRGVLQLDLPRGLGEEQGPHAGRVDERQPAQVDHHGGVLAQEALDPLLQRRHRQHVELAAGRQAHTVVVEQLGLDDEAVERRQLGGAAGVVVVERPGEVRSHASDEGPWIEGLMGGRRGHAPLLDAICRSCWGSSTLHTVLPVAVRSTPQSRLISATSRRPMPPIRPGSASFGWGSEWGSSSVTPTRSTRS